MSLVRAATSISVLTLLSRVLGLVRDVLMARLIGVNWVSGAFVLAWMVPNLLRRLFGEGALSAAFIPAFTRARESAGNAAARRLLAGVSGALLLILIGLTTVVITASWLLPDEIIGLEGTAEVTPAEHGALVWDLTRLLFPYVVPICLLAIYAGALNAAGVFAPTAAAPVVLNLFWIGGLLVAAQWAEGLAAMVRIVAISLLCGSVVQLGLAVVPLWRRGLLAAPALPTPGDGTREVFTRMAPAALGLSIVQFNLLLDQALAEVLIGPGSDYHIYLANRLVLFPHALVAIPLATAVFPQMAKWSDDAARLGKELDRALRYTMFLALPAAVGMAFVARPLIELVFVGGRYTSDNAVDTAWTTTALVAGLPALGATQLYARALFAGGDTKTPARIAAWFVLVNLTGNLVLVLGLGFGVEGFAIATTLSAYGNVLALRRAVHRSGIRTPGGLRDWLPNVACCVGMAGVLALLVGAPPDGDFELAWRGLALPIAAGAATYFLLAVLLRVPELRDLAAWWKRRHSARTNSM